MTGVEEHERRRPLLIAAVGFAMLETRPEPPALTTLKSWLSSWAGIGAVIAGMTRQGFNVEVRQFPKAGGELLSSRAGTLGGRRLGLGADARPSRAAGGVGGAEQGQR